MKYNVIHSIHVLSPMSFHFENKNEKYTIQVSNVIDKILIFLEKEVKREIGLLGNDIFTGPVGMCDKYSKIPTAKGNFIYDNM